MMGGGMGKRRKYVLLAAIVLVAVGLGAAFIPSREPSYGGKRLSEWVEIYATPPSRETEVAAYAIRSIGTNGLPYLLHWIQYEAPPWKTWLYERVSTLICKLAGNARIVDKKEYRASDAVVAFSALGPEGTASLPELIRLLNSPKPTVSAVRAAYALGCIGKDGLAPLLLVLTNRQAGVSHHCVVASLGIIGTNAGPALMKLMNEPDSNIRMIATNALQRIDPHALEKVTAQ